MMSSSATHGKTVYRPGELAHYINVGTGLGVWFDERIRGGQAWWDEILAAIRACELFIPTSPWSLTSEACMRELTYARRQDRPILPIAVGDLHGELPGVLADLQIVAFDGDSALGAVTIVGAAA